jgi:hypothetical protein
VVTRVSIDVLRSARVRRWSAFPILSTRDLPRLLEF